LLRRSIRFEKVRVTTYDSKVVRMFRFVIAPTTQLLARLHNKFMDTTGWPLVIVISFAEHLCPTFEVSVASHVHTSAVKLVVWSVE
jgi:hypothetical protein